MKLKSLILLALVGCDEEASHHHHTGESEIAIGCDHFAYGEDQPRTATLDTPGAEATLAAVHQRFVITLPATEDTGAKLAFVANESGDYYFMLGEVVPFEILQADAAGDLTLTPVEVVTPGEECTAAARVHRYQLEAGTYTLVIGPTEATELTLVPHLAGQDHSH